MKPYQNHLPRLIGHRGAKGLAPENTVPSLRVARDLGVSWVEFDVQLTADGVPVVIHDETLDRTTDGRGPVAAITWAELQNRDAGAWFSPNFVGVRVPSFDEVMAELGALGLGANVEIKPAPGQEAETARVVMAAIAAGWPTTLPRPLISSFQPASLAVVNDMTPDQPRAALFEKNEAGDAEVCIATAKALGCTSIHVAKDDQALTADFVTALHDAGFAVRAYTVNEATTAAALFDMGVDGLFTDYPDRLSAFLG